MTEIAEDLGGAVSTNQNQRDCGLAAMILPTASVGLVVEPYVRPNVSACRAGPSAFLSGDDDERFVPIRLRMKPGAASIASPGYLRVSAARRYCLSRRQRLCA